MRSDTKVPVNQTDNSIHPEPVPGVSRRSFIVGSVAAAAAGMMASHAWSSAASNVVSASGDDILAWAPAWRLQDMFQAKELSPLEYAQYLLARVEKHSDLGAFITVFPDLLLKQAAEATEQLMKRGDRPMLHGLPVSLKDTIFTKGQRTTLGSSLFEDHIPEIDAIASEQVKRHGGIIFAKSNTPEFALNRRTVNLVSLEAVNPWDRSRSSGGSSGGAAVASAAGLGPLALGTDGGGSIRIPSSFNGVFGLHPSRGRVPNGAGYWGNGTSGIGPMTRDVRDSAMLLQAVAAVNKRDPFSMSSSPPDYLGELEKGVEGLRMAWSPDIGRVAAEDDKVVALCHDAARLFEKMGAIYSEPYVRLEDPHDQLEPDKDYSREQMDALFRSIQPGYENVMVWASKLSREDYTKLSVYFRNRDVHPNEVDYAMSITPEVRYRKKTRLADLFSQIDLLMSPVIGRTAFQFDEPGVTPWQYTAYTHVVNVAGYCAASVPVGFLDGMPVGLHIVGRPNDEHLILRAARALEKERPWAHKKPNLNT